MGASSSSEPLYNPVNDLREEPQDLEARVSCQSILSTDSKIVGIDLEWENIHFSVPGKEAGSMKHILNGCSGQVKQGECACIIGPSGAGKTTMMNLLAGRVSAPWEGEVTANGLPVEPRQFSQSIAYVMQDEALFATATPREALHFSAAMRLPPSTTIAARTRLVNSLLKDLNLEECADTLVGSVLIPGISGGEKKRTSVGVELITQPKIIFLDEPTSGLDTYSAYHLVQILKALCQRGCSVVCTIHQPSSEIFHLFDKTILIQSGSIVYNGRVDEMVSYFSTLGSAYECPPNYNPADHVMFLMQKKESKDSPYYLRDKWAEREKNEQKLLVDQSIKLEKKRSQFQVSYSSKAGILRQFQHLITREARNTVRDKKTLFTRFFLTIFLNLLYGMVFKGVGSRDDMQSRYGALLQLCVSAMFGCAQPAILTFPFERPVFIREYVSGTYNLVPYFLSKAIMEIPLAALQTLAGLMTSYFLMELKGRFIRLWMGMFLLGVVSSSVAIALGCATTNVKTAIEAVPLAFVPQMLFAGFFVPIAQIPVYLRWSQWLCTLKYSINIMLLTEFTEDTPLVNALLERESVKRSEFWFYIAMLLVLFVAFRIVGMIALGLRSRSQF